MKIILWAFAALCSMCSSPSQAAMTLEISLQNGVFGNSSIFCSVGPYCDFVDTITFTTASPFDLVSAQISTIAYQGVGSTSDISFTSVTLDGVNMTLVSLFGGIYEVGAINDLSFSAPGVHSLVVKGITYGMSVGLDGSYSGNLTFASSMLEQSGVPEPSVWLSLLSGFGIMGIALRHPRLRQPGYPCGLASKACKL